MPTHGDRRGMRTGWGSQMTSTVESEPIAEALAIIDKSLMNLIKRELVSSNEVADVLLDVRALLSTVDADEN